MARVAIIQGHPDAAGGHFCHALADAYADCAVAAGHSVARIEVARLNFPWLSSKEAFEHGALPPVLLPGQQAIGAADHLLVVYPLWLGSMPAVLKAFFEQVFRPGFAFPAGDATWAKRLKGRSARIVVTMGMPVLVYRWYFGAHGLKSLERSVLRFCGIGPIRESLFGMIDAATDAKRARWLAEMQRLGRAGR